MSIHIMLSVSQFTNTYYRTIADQKCPAPETEIWGKKKGKKWLKHKLWKNWNSTGASLGDQEQNTEWLRHRKPEKPMSDGKNFDFYAHLHIYCQMSLKVTNALKKIVLIKMNSLCCMFLNMQYRL